MHQLECFLVYPAFQLVGIRVYEEPFRQHHVKMFYVVFQRQVGTFVPVYIPCRAYSHTGVGPFGYVFLRQAPGFSYKAVLPCGYTRIVAVHSLLLKEVAERLVFF